MMQHLSPCEDTFSTPANLRPTMNSGMFDDFLSPPSMVLPNARCSELEQHQPHLNPEQRRSFVLRMDQRLRQQREEVEHEQAEHSDQVISTAGLDMFVPREGDLADGLGFFARRTTLSLRPYFYPPSTPAQICAACAKLSMETPPRPNATTTPTRQSPHCLQCSHDRHMTPLLLQREQSRPMQVVVDAQFLRSNNNDKDDEVLLDLSMDSEMDDADLNNSHEQQQQPRRILLRPKMQLANRSQSSSPILSTSSSSSILEETDYIDTFEMNGGENDAMVLSTSVFAPRPGPPPLSAIAPLLPLMSPENSRPVFGRSARLQIRIPTVGSYSTPDGLQTPC